jgi:hypothetical protein
MLHGTCHSSFLNMQFSLLLAELVEERSILRAGFFIVGIAQEVGRMHTTACYTKQHTGIRHLREGAEQ